MNTFPVSEIADNIITLIKQHVSLFDDFVNVYLFGSVLDNKNNDPKDVDLLLIYAAQSDTLVSAVEIIRSTLWNESGMPIDLTVLSIAEEQEVHFIKRLNSLCLKVK